MRAMSNRTSTDAPSASREDLEKGEDFQEQDRTTGKEQPIPNDGTSKEEPDQRNIAASNLPNVKDWNGPDDPANPLNWNITFKAYHVVVSGLFAFAVTFGTSVYTPAVADVMRHFNTSRTAALTGLSVYTLGLGFGPIFSAPLSEKYGRRVVYLTSPPIFMLFTLGAGFSQSLASFVVCRFFAGLTGSPSLAVGAGTNADLFVPNQRAVVSSLFLAAPFAGPALGPVIGGFIAQYKDWRWTQWCMLFLQVGVYIPAFAMRETYKPIILARRAKKHSLTPLERVTSSTATVKTAVLRNLIRPLHMLATEPVVFFLSLYTAFAFGILFLFFAAIPFIFSAPPYSFTTSQTGLIFLAIGLGVLLGSATGIIVDQKIYQRHHQQALAAGLKGAPPEHRLYCAMMGSPGICIGLFWMAWTAEKGVHWAAPVVSCVSFAWGFTCVFSSCILFMLDVYGPLNGASAVAANGIFRYVLGAVFPLFAVQMYQELGTGWATSLIGFLSLLMLPIPWVFFKWGPGIRKRSRYPVII